MTWFICLSFTRGYLCGIVGRDPVCPCGATRCRWNATQPTVTPL